MKHDEYRRLTFLFCDVVSSTAMAQRLDAEDWRATLHAFQSTCSSVIEAHGGTVHDNPGDGLLAYFGFPALRENSAVDAVRAALDIARGSGARFAEQNRMLELARLEPLRVRIGVHTGPVVMGSVDGRITATGVSLHFAERLHKHAAPDTVLVSEATRQLVGTRFELVELGPKTLKGFEDPATCFRVEGENAPRTLFGTPFVGRRAELDILEREWRTVRTDPPRAVLIAGEAGIGKSRLIRQFSDGPCVDGATVVCWYGAEDTRHSSLHPIVEHLRQAAPDAASGVAEPGPALAALERLVPASSDRERLVPVLASLLSVPSDSRYPPLEGTAKGMRETVHAALADWLIHESWRRPLLLVLEDVRLMDPATLEVVERVVRDPRAGSMLLLMSCRTETSDTWSCPFTARLLTLGRLPLDAVQALIRSSPGADDLSECVVRQVVDRSDGIPLFVEESTAMALDAAATGPESDDCALDREPAPFVPVRLTDLLIERLDRVGEARESAGVAAAIGREFTRSLLRSVSLIDEEELDDHLESLLRSGLVKLVDSAPERTFCFKHALVRDAAYGTLLRSRRRNGHARIAEALVTRAAAGERVRPEQLAHHYTEAGLLEQAIEGWLAAGHQARRRSEQAEAIEHYRRVPTLLDRLPRDTSYPIPQCRLTTQLALAACHVALDGYSSEEARCLYENAETLADRLGRTEQMFNARLGLETYFHMRGDFGRAMRLAESCLDMARRAHRASRRGASERHEASVMALAKSNWTIGALQFHQGRFDCAMTHLSRCLRYCETVAPDRRAALHDPVVMCQVYRSWYAWECGRADDALRSVEKTVSHARASGHAFSLGMSLSFNACIHLFRCEYAEAVERASACMAVCERAGFRTWLAWAMIIRGRARCENAHDRRGGFADLEEGLRIWNDVGAIVTRPFSQTLLAEAYLLDGRAERALASVREALSTVERYGERYYEPEIRRVHARALLHPDSEPAAEPSPGNHARAAQAERSLEQAIAFATARGMNASVLRSTTDLARLRLERERTASTSDADASANALEAALEAIEQDENNTDARRARELLHALRARPGPLSIAR